MNEPAYAIREQHIHFLWLYDRSHLAFTKRGMRQYLSFTIRSSAIVWGADFSGSTRSCAGAIRDA